MGPTSYQFNSRYTLGNTLPDFTEDDVKAEPMFFSADIDFAYWHGGPVTRAFITAMTEDGQLAQVFDSRVHMLMPGWLPAIPGWHHDDVPRGDGSHPKLSQHGQPNYDAPGYLSRHTLALIGGEIAPTEFAIGTHRLPKIEPGNGPVYKHWHDAVEKQIEAGELARENVPSNVLVNFDWQTMHRAVPAVKRGWRWFGRASWQTDRPILNEIRKQVQVYLPVPTEGW
jgi:hypothetical protein